MSSPVLTTAERRRRTKQVFLSLAPGDNLRGDRISGGLALQVIWASSTVGTISFAILGRLNRVTKADAHAVANARASAPVHVPVATQTAWRPPALPEPLGQQDSGRDTPLPSHDELVRAARAKALEMRPEDFEGEGWRLSRRSNLARKLPPRSSRSSTSMRFSAAGGLFSEGSSLAAGAIRRRCSRRP
jgi:hypothetical protein